MRLQSLVIIALTLLAVACKDHGRQLSGNVADDARIVIEAELKNARKADFDASDRLYGQLLSLYGEDSDSLAHFKQALELQVLTLSEDEYQLLCRYESEESFESLPNVDKFNRAAMRDVNMLYDIFDPVFDDM
ncbi:MAG: hypothetical protein NC111_07405 [Bacteroides sp.]|nr:hypothetical protein [Bacteroides sp.]MCM1414066.1 hypothetical protein [Bacteroides sp.]MCM1472335.1 hypothetical protein [Bacteroides sp.]